MKIEYLPTFIKDLKRLKSNPNYEKIKNIVTKEILEYQNISQIKNMKKLKGENNAYRIRVGDYRIGFFLKDETIIFSRVLHRQEIYHFFP